MDEGNSPAQVSTTLYAGRTPMVVVFFLAQRAFMRGIVVTGVDK